MLLASVGQAASYAQHSTTSAVGGGSSSTSQKTQQSLTRPLLVSANNIKNNKTSQYSNNSNGSANRLQPAAPSTTTSLMKTLAVRLHRGTEFIRDTVQRALVDTAAGTTTKTITCSASASTSTTSSSGTSASSQQSSLSSFAKAEQHTKVKTGVSTSVSSTLASTSTKQHSKGPSKELHRHQRHQHSQHHSKSNLNEIPPPTALHRSTEARQNASSTDSLLKELCHFKPIRPMPLTRNKLGNKPPGCDIKCPQFIKPTKKDLAFNSALDKATGSSVRSNNSSNLSSQNLQQQSPVLKSSGALSPTKSSQAMQKQPEEEHYKSAFVCLIGIKYNDNEDDVKATSKKQQSKTTTNLNDKQQQKPRRRRRRNAFGVPKRRIRKSLNEIDADNSTEKGGENRLRNMKSASQEGEKKPYQQRKRKVEIEIEKDDDNDNNELIRNSQPTKSKRQRLTKDYKAMIMSTSSLSKNMIGNAVGKLKLITKNLEEKKKVAASTNSAHSSRNRKSNETLRSSPPMTRQRARQISYNQSK